MGTTEGLGQYVRPSDADKYVVEGCYTHLTKDIVVWIESVFDEWELVRIRYEWEKLIEKAHGNDLFLELTYESKVPGLAFPCAQFCSRNLKHWHIYFVDFCEYSFTKVIIRMAPKEV